MWTLFFAAHASMRWYALRNHASTRRPGSLTLEAPSRNSAAFRKWVSSEDIRVLITRHVLKRHGGAREPGEMQAPRCGPRGERPRGAPRDGRGPPGARVPQAAPPGPRAARAPPGGP